MIYNAFSITRVTLVISLLASVAHAQSILKVNASGGVPGSFATIQAAVDVAGAADLILVSPGTYPGFELGATGLTIVADSGLAPVVVTGLVSVSNLSAPESTAIFGLDFDSPALLVQNCTGHVYFQDCSFGNAGSLGANALSIELSSAVTMVDCRIEFRDAIAVGGLANAMRVIDSSVYLYGTDLTPGRGKPGFPFGGGTNGGVGPAGLFLQSSFALAVDCTIHGGEGGEGAVPPSPSLPGSGGCTNGGDGGPAVELQRLSITDPVSQLIHAGTKFVGGNPGAATLECMSGFPGPALLTLAGVETPLGVAARTLAATSPVRVGEQYNFRLQGEPGDLYALTFTLSGLSPTFQPTINGVDYLGLPELAVVVRFLNANGRARIRGKLNPIGQPFLELHTQAYLLGSEQLLVATNPQVVTLISP